MRHGQAEGRCPLCKHEPVDYGDTDAPGPDCEYTTWACPSCGAEGREWRTLQFDGHTMDHDTLADSLLFRYVNVDV